MSAALFVSVAAAAVMILLKFVFAAKAKRANTSSTDRFYTHKEAVTFRSSPTTYVHSPKGNLDMDSTSTCLAYGYPTGGSFYCEGSNSGFGPH